MADRIPTKVFGETASRPATTLAKPSAGKDFAGVLQQRMSTRTATLATQGKAAAGAKPQTPEGSSALDQILRATQENLIAMSGRSAPVAKLDAGQNDLDGENVCESPGGDGF